MSERLNLLSGMFGAFGIQIHESPLAFTMEPVRKHKRTRHQTEAYHRRVQKKWTKRYGKVKVPAAFFIDPAAAGLPFLLGNRIYAHPSIVGVIRNLSL